MMMMMTTTMMMTMMTTTTWKVLTAVRNIIKTDDTQSFIRSSQTNNIKHVMHEFCKHILAFRAAGVLR
jgi:hypothetical protein